MLHGGLEALGFGANAAKIHVGSQVKRLAVVTPTDVGNLDARIDRAEVFAFWTDDENTVWPGGEEVSFSVQFQSVAESKSSLFGNGLGIEEDAGI